MITVQNLTYRYPGNKSDTLRGLDFEVRTGEIFGFLGPSGSGKSTTQKILTGLLRDYSGSVKVLGTEVQSHGGEFYEAIGVSFEVPNHYLKLTALENLNYFRSLFSGERADPQVLMERLGLMADAHQRVANFSKGMRVRLGIARMLLNDPQLLFLDEPTAGLDPGNARIVKELILEHCARGHTAFLTTHDMTVAAQLCNRVAFLVEGEIRVIDNPRQLTLEHGEPLVRVECGSEPPFSIQDFPLEGLADNQAFLEVLRGETIQAIHSRETTLEEVFIKVTGKRLQ